jgi:hypothetical protein
VVSIWTRRWKKDKELTSARTAHERRIVEKLQLMKNMLSSSHGNEAFPVVRHEKFNDPWYLFRLPMYKCQES